MFTADLNQFWEVVGGVFLLKAEVFQQINTISNGLLLALFVVLAAGLSIAIAQSIILFLNRVKPVRFVFSLLISAVLYTFGYLFLVVSTWLICLVPWSVHVSLETLVKVFGLSYVVLLFGFLGALPYLGAPVLWILSIWHLLAMVVGFATVAHMSLGSAFRYVAIGWVVLQVLQQTIGQPIANLGRWLASLVAGVQLVTGRGDLIEIVRTGLHQVSSPLAHPSRGVVPEAQRLIQSAGKIVEEVVATGQKSSERSVGRQKDSSGGRKWLKPLLGLLGIAIFTALVAVLLDPLQDAWSGQYDHLPEVLQLGFDLIWIGLVALVVAGLLAPLETLGWWAGWYHDEVDTTVNTGSLGDPIADPSSISRYVIYLDGISQSSAKYLPDVEAFLEALIPALPDHVALIRGLVTYSVLNNPLDEDRPLAFLWQLADKSRLANPTSLLGLIVNLRNILIVSVSADRRYGPLYNQGIAQIMYNSLLNNGYQPGSGIPVTLIGYSGGGQMSAAAATFLRRAIAAPVDVISLGGVISGNCNILQLEHLYHLVGQKDSVEQLGPIMFPGRWPLYWLSYWNRAKRLGKISLISLGSVGHQVPGGLMDPQSYLPDGRSYLQQTVELITQILNGKLLAVEQRTPRQPSNYERYRQAAWNRPDYYPLNQKVDPKWYQPIGCWMGRLILPKLEERPTIRGVLFEVHYAPADYQYLVGQVVNLRWANDPTIQSLVRAATRDVHFTADAEYSSEFNGVVHPVRLNHWQQVDPLESLAGSHLANDVIVRLADQVVIEDPQQRVRETRNEEGFTSSDWDTQRSVSLYIRSQPVQITGRFYSLIRFLEPISENTSGTGTPPEQFRVVHFNRSSRQFDGPEETVRLPAVVADQNDCFPSNSQGVEQSPLNEIGWYIYGAKDASGMFVVQSLAPRVLLRLQPDKVIMGCQPAYQYIRKQAWADIETQKGKISSVLLKPKQKQGKEVAMATHFLDQPIRSAIAQWQEGDRALVLHVYGGIGGKKREPAAATPIFFGHFAYGVAQVVKDPLADELRFEITYYQVYSHNTDGLVAGALHWSRYLGDRQFGWIGVRPTCDILIKLDAFTKDFEFNGRQYSALNVMLRHLEVMTARYRIGDGTGGTYIGPANNCSQDSNQALFASIRSLKRLVESNAALMEAWLSQHPQQAKRYQRLERLEKALQRKLQPLGAPRSDWQKNEYNLGSTLEDAPLRNLITGLGSWRTMLPRFASDTVVQVFLQHNASVWVLRTTQIGGSDPDITPIAPMTF